MASPAACALYSSLVAAVRVSTAPRRRPASLFSRVHIPPAARTAPRSLSVSLSVLRPCAHHGASDRESAGPDTGFGFPRCDPAVEDPYDIAATTDNADDGFLHVPLVEDPLELVATTGLGEGAHEGDADLVLRVPTVEEPNEVAAVGDPHEFTATTDLCVDVDVLRVLTVEEPCRQLAATTGALGEAAHDEADDVGDDDVLYPLGLTKKELHEFETTDFSRAAINERFRLESKEAKAAVTGAVAGVLRPLRELVDDVRSLRSVFDLKEFQIGMPFGAIMACMGMYQLCKLSPSTCIDVAMYYAFYKLSVIAADVRRRGFSPDWIIRINLCIIVAVLAKERGNEGVVPLVFIRLAIFGIYILSVMWDMKGLKKYASRCFLRMLFHELKYSEEETTSQWKWVKAT